MKHEFEVKYSDYKTKYDSFRTKKDSYNPVSKTIVIYVSDAFMCKIELLEFGVSEAKADRFLSTGYTYCYKSYLATKDNYSSESAERVLNILNIMKKWNCFNPCIMGTPAGLL